MRPIVHATRWLLVSGILLAAGAEAAERGYPLTCRAGPGMGMEIARGSGWGRIEVYFRRGARAASSGVEAGTCTWADRGFRQNEPACLRMVEVYDMRFIADAQGRVTRLTSPTAPFVSTVLAQQGTFVVRARNVGNCMLVTHVGP